jgi:hypothetical protein
MPAVASRTSQMFFPRVVISRRLIAPSMRTGENARPEMPPETPATENADCEPPGKPGRCAIWVTNS